MRHLETSAGITSPASASALRVLAFVERDALRDLLEMLIETDPELSCAGIHTGTDRFTAALAAEAADILLVDADMSGVAVFPLIRYARQHFPHLHIVGLLSGDDQVRVQALITEGCHRCVFKRTTAEDFLGALKKSG